MGIENQGFLASSRARVLMTGDVVRNNGGVVTDLLRELPPKRDYVGEYLEDKPETLALLSQSARVSAHYPTLNRMRDEVARLKAEVPQTLVSLAKNAGKTLAHPGFAVPTW